MSIIESVQSYDLNIPVGGGQSIDVEGDRVQFLSAVDPFAQIEIRPNFSQGNISLKPGQGFKFSQRVTRWVVLNKSNVPLSGYLLIGSGDFFDQRISGTVDVIDGAKARTLGGIAFMGGGGMNPLAANVPHVQLWNPAGSGKNLILESVLVSAANGGVTNLRPNTAALATLYGTCPSKLLGAAVGVAQVRTQHSGAALGGDPLTGSYVAANGQVNTRFIEPVVIRPGNGLVVQGGINNDLAAFFEFFEAAA